MSEEKVLDAENWRNEARSVINDVSNHVKTIEISASSANDDGHIYLNVTTLENANYCVELSAAGFRIVGVSHDANDLDDGERYETPYALLGKISASFRRSFADELMSKLKRAAE
ncbi:GSK3B-interacting protein-like [Photinus pyralis]|uniref:GSKIP domain-containing protein n=1 Tax=Photinus pyralis TaxID=7054 RepID=A0A1Y1KNP4_PHOPY|nr:GSK3B-interacting protein-like [Photinus pyralis]